MRFKLDSDVQRVQNKRTPHLWFAWRPVRISPTEIAWLENVIREGTYYWKDSSIPRPRRVWSFTYRAQANTTERQDKRGAE